MHLFQAVNTSGLIAFLLEITLKGTLVLAAAGLATAVLKTSSAAVRHLIWSTALVLLLALPVFVVFTPTYDVPVLPADLSSPTAKDMPRKGVLPAVPVEQPVSERPSTGRQAAPDMTPLFRADSRLVRSKARAGRSVRPTIRAAVPVASNRRFAWHQALFILWIMGAGFVFARYFVGWIALRRLCRRTVPVSDVRLRLLVKRLAGAMNLSRRIHVVWGAPGSMPLTFGCIHPTVLLPEDAKEWDRNRLLVVLRHELAHVKRCDCLTQAIVYVSCTLYWFNPLVWLAAAKSHREREMACDDYVLTTGAPGHDYAGHLLDIARSLRGPSLSGVTTIAMARRSELEGRLMAILSTDRKREGASLRGVLATVAVLGCLVMTLAALRPVAMHVKEKGERSAEKRVAVSESLQQAPIAVASSAVSAVASASAGDQITAYDERYVERASAIVEKAAETLETSLKKLVPRKITVKGSVIAYADAGVKRIGDGGFRFARQDTIPLEEIRRLREAGIDAAYIEELASVGLKGLSIDQLVALAHSHVDAEYVRRLQRAGYDNISVDDLVELGCAGVDADEIASWAEFGYKNLPSSTLIELAHADIDPSYVEELQGAGVHLSVAELIQLGYADIDPAFIRSMDEIGLKNLSVQDLIRLSNANVDSDFVRQMCEAGYSNLSVDQLIRLSHADVDPSYVSRISHIGLKNLQPDQLIRLTYANVDADFIAQMKAAGYKDLTVPALEELSQQDIDADFIRELGKAGLKDLSLQDLVTLGHAGIDAAFVREMKQSGYSDLSAEELIQLRYANVDPDYIRELARGGLTGLSPEELVELSHADIDANVVAQFVKAGYKNLSTSDLIQLGYAGVDADFIEEMKSVGLTNLSATDLMILANSGVTTDDVRRLRKMGVKTNDARKIVRLKYMDMDPEYVESIQKAMAQ